MSTHTAKSPSKFERIRLCPGSQREESRYPDQKGGPAAADGTHTHTLLELCVEDGVTDAEEYLNSTITDHEGEFTVDRDRCRRVNVALGYIYGRALKAGVDPLPEVRLDSLAAFGRTDMGGTCDVHLFSKEHRFLEVMDYKDGMGVVEPDCDQMKIYALMLVAQYGAENIDVVRLTIIQPKLEYRGDKGVVHTEVSTLDLLKDTAMFMAAAALADTPDAPLTPGDKQCKYCKHKGACAALTGSMMEASGISFQNLDVAKQAAEKNPTELTAEELRDLVEAAPLLRQLLEAVEAEALRRMEAGQTIEGLKVVRGRGSRSWMFDESEMAEKLKKFGIPKDALWKTSLISPAQAEKVVWEKRDGTRKQLSERQLKQMEAEYIKKSTGKLTVVSVADPRESAIVSAVPMFGTTELPSWLI